MLFKLKKKEDKEMNPWSSSWLRNIYDEVIYDNQEWVGREQAMALGKYSKSKTLEITPEPSRLAPATRPTHIAAQIIYVNLGFRNPTLVLVDKKPKADLVQSKQE